MTTGIIICAGSGHRWRHHDGGPKHLITLEGEVLLDRTIRQFNEYFGHEPYVVALDDRYRRAGSQFYRPRLDWDTNRDADKFLSSKELWSGDSRTLVLYGDVWFSEQAFETIANHTIVEWTLFGRRKASAITGCKWGECFAQSFYPEHRMNHEEHLHRIAALARQGELRRCGGWEHYRSMVGIGLRRHMVTTNFVNIDDFTDDFDFPGEYNRWVRKRSEWRGQQGRSAD